MSPYLLALVQYYKVYLFFAISGELYTDQRIQRYAVHAM